MKPTTKAVWKVSLALVALFLVIAGIKALQFKKMMSAKMVMPPTTVTSAEVKKSDWQPMLTAVGSISPVQGRDDQRGTGGDRGRD